MSTLTIRKSSVKVIIVKYIVNNMANKSTPAMEQYFHIKDQHQDCLLFYRMGDFYELFFDDAITAANVLNIVLTQRGKHNGKSIPMCGVPAHIYINL